MTLRMAWLFPGQGAQEVGMGKALAEASPEARAVFERADQALGESISSICFEGPIETLTLTRNTQPALVATSAALLAALRARHPHLPAPHFAAGHSLGEYSALVAAGALSLEDAVRLCRTRGQAMQDAVPPGVGAMAALLNLEPAVVDEVCREAAQDEVVSAANFNAPGQIVIAGHAAAVERAGKLAGGRGGKVIPLKVSAPFHCALMKPAAEVMAGAFASVTIRPLAFPVIANVDAVANRDEASVSGLLLRQIDGPVRWIETIELMVAQGVSHALEIGPGKVLAGLAKRINKQLRVLNVSDLESLEKVPAFLAEG